MKFNYDFIRVDRFEFFLIYIYHIWNTVLWSFMVIFCLHLINNIYKCFSNIICFILSYTLYNNTYD